ncbi:MAG: hypothetical protein ACJAT4_002801 [Granulosicoccus sp.]|jgi:hypothetical protein
MPFESPMSCEIRLLNFESLVTVKFDFNFFFKKKSQSFNSLNIWDFSGFIILHFNLNV